MPSAPTVALTVKDATSILASISGTPDSGTSITSYELQRSLNGSTWTTLPLLIPSQSSEVDRDYPFNTATPTKYVSLSGSVNGITAYTTIQAAVNAAVPGDIIAVASGTYKETVLVNKSGTAAAPIYIQALNPNNKPVIDGEMIRPIGTMSNGAEGRLVAISGSHIVWDSIDIVNSRGAHMTVMPSTWNNGNFLQSYEINTWFQNIKVLRTTMRKCNAKSFQCLNVDGLYIGKCSFIETCRASDAVWNSTTADPTGWPGAVALSGKNVSLIESIVAQALGEGVLLGNHVWMGDGVFVQCENGLIRGCRIFDTWSGALYVNAINGGIVENNAIYQTNDTRFWKGRNSNGYPAESVAIASEAGRPPETQYGKVAPWSTGFIGNVNLTIRNNVIMGGHRCLGFPYEPNQVLDNIKIQNNLIYKPQTGTYARGAGAIRQENTSDNGTIIKNLTLENNIIYDAAGNVVPDELGYPATPGGWRDNNIQNFVKRNNLWSHSPPTILQGNSDIVNTSIGITNLSYAPTGAWPSISTFDTNAIKLTSSSPAIGAGFLNGIETDFFQSARNPTSMDIGAHTVNAASGSSYESNGLTSNTTYYFRARFTQSNGVVSSYSSAVSATTDSLITPTKSAWRGAASAVTTNQVGVQSLNVSKGSTQVGDIVGLAVLICNETRRNDWSTSVPIFPDGFSTPITADSSAANGWAKAYIAFKKAGSSEPANYTIRYVESGGPWRITAIRFTRYGHHETNWLDQPPIAVFNSTASNNINLPAITPVGTDGCELISIAMATDGQSRLTQGNFTSAPGETEYSEVTDTESWTTVQVSSRSITGTAAIPARNATMNSGAVARSFGISVLLREPGSDAQAPSLDLQYPRLGAYINGPYQSFTNQAIINTLACHEVLHILLDVQFQATAFRTSIPVIKQAAPFTQYYYAYLTINELYRSGVSGTVPTLIQPRALEKFNSMNWWLYPGTGTTGNVNDAVGAAFDPINLAEINLTSYTPADSRGVRPGEWLAEAFYNRFYRTGLTPTHSEYSTIITDSRNYFPELDGLFFDNWFFIPRVNGNWNRTGGSDSADDITIAREWRRGYIAAANKFKTLSGKGVSANLAEFPQALVGRYPLDGKNPADYDAVYPMPEIHKVFDAGAIEYFVGPPGVGYTTEANLNIEQLKLGYKRSLDSVIYPERVVTFNETGSNIESGVYALGLTTVFGDAACHITGDGATTGAIWLDEMSVNRSTGVAYTGFSESGVRTGLRWLGRAVDPPQWDKPEWKNGIYRRRFEFGEVYVNYKDNGTRTAALDQSMKTISGTQRPTVNNGTVIQQITLPARSAIFLLYTSTPPPLPPVANFTTDKISGTKPLTVKFTDSSTNSPTSWEWDFDSNGNVDSRVQNPSYTYSVSGTYVAKLKAINSAGSSEKQVTITVNDSPPTPQKNDANLFPSNSPPTFNNLNNGILSFDGTEDFISTGTAINSTSFLRFTIGIWFKTDTANGAKLIGFENNRTGVSSSFDRHLYIGTDGKLYFGAYKTSNVVVSTSYPVNDEIWRYATAVYDGVALKLYVNAQLIAETALDSIANYTGYWRIGGGTLNNWLNSGNNDFFKGYISSAHIYSRALTPGEIVRNYNARKSRFIFTPLPIITAETKTTNSVTIKVQSPSDTTFTYPKTVVHRSSSANGPWFKLPTITAPSTNVVDTELQPNTNYFYRAKITRIDNRNSEWTNTIQVTTNSTGVTPPPPTIPSTPTGLTATAISTTQINLSWTDNADNEANYIVERVVGVGDGFTEIATLSAGSTTYSSLELAPNTTYSFRVKAKNSVGDSAPSNIAVMTTLSTPPVALPTAPTNLTATAVSSVQINLSWTDNADNEANYIVERSISGGFSVEIATLGAGVSSYQNIGLNPNTSYTYKIKARNSVGDSSSITATATTPNAPAPFTTIRVNCGGATYTDPQGNIWTADNGNKPGTITTSAADSIAILGTDKQPIYRSTRWDAVETPAVPMTYNFTVPNGDYVIRFHFADIYTGITKIGDRVFGIKINNTAVVTDLDIFKEAQGIYKALVKSYDISNSIGAINIEFTRVTENPTVNGIEIYAKGTEPLLPGTEIKVMFIGDSISQGGHVNGAALNESAHVSPRAYTLRELRRKGYTIRNIGTEWTPMRVLTDSNGNPEPILDFIGQPVDDSTKFAGYAVQAQGGYTLTQMRDVLVPKAVTAGLKPDVVIIQGGTNGFSQTDGPTQLESLVNACAQSFGVNCKIIILGILPSTIATSTQTLPLRQKAASLADNITRFWADPYTTSGLDVATDTTDGVHLTLEGSRKVAINSIVPAFIKAFPDVIALPSPSAPTLTLAVLENSSIRLSIAATPTTGVNISSYIIQRTTASNPSESDWATIKTINSSQTSISEDDTALISNITYRYRVKFAQNNGTESPFSSVQSATTQNTISTFVTSSLAFAYDPANVLSYPGTGTTITDLNPNASPTPTPTDAVMNTRFAGISFVQLSDFGPTNKDWRFDGTDSQTGQVFSSESPKMWNVQWGSPQLQMINQNPPIGTTDTAWTRTFTSDGLQITRNIPFGVNKGVPQAAYRIRTGGNSYGDVSIPFTNQTMVYIRGSIKFPAGITSITQGGFIILCSTKFNYGDEKVEMSISRDASGWWTNIAVQGGPIDIWGNPNTIRYDDSGRPYNQTPNRNSVPLQDSFYSEVTGASKSFSSRGAFIAGNQSAPDPNLWYTYEYAFRLQAPDPNNLVSPYSGGPVAGGAPSGWVWSATSVGTSSSFATKGSGTQRLYIRGSNMHSQPAPGSTLIFPFIHYSDLPVEGMPFTWGQVEVYNYWPANASPHPTDAI